MRSNKRDDGSHARFNADGQRLPIKVSGLTNVGFVTCFDIWRDAVVAGTSLGKLALINKNNKVEKVIDAHSGAVLGVKWAGDGTLIVSRTIFLVFIFAIDSSLQQMARMVPYKVTPVKWSHEARSTSP